MHVTAIAYALRFLICPMDLKNRHIWVHLGSCNQVSLHFYENQLNPVFSTRAISISHLLVKEMRLCEL